jgi:hypothetical protein
MSEKFDAVFHRTVPKGISEEISVLVEVTAKDYDTFIKLCDAIHKVLGDDNDE